MMKTTKVGRQTAGFLPIMSTFIFKLDFLEPGLKNQSPRRSHNLSKQSQAVVFAISAWYLLLLRIIRDGRFIELSARLQIYTTPKKSLAAFVLLQRLLCGFPNHRQLTNFPIHCLWHSIAWFKVQVASYQGKSLNFRSRRPPGLTIHAVENQPQ